MPWNFFSFKWKKGFFQFLIILIHFDFWPSAPVFVKKHSHEKRKIFPFLITMKEVIEFEVVFFNVFHILCFFFDDFPIPLVIQGLRLLLNLIATLVFKNERSEIFNNKTQYFSNCGIKNIRFLKFTPINAWYGKTGVTSYELRVASYKLRAETQKCNFKSTSYEFKSTSYEFKSTSFEFKSTSYKFKSTSYEFKSTSYELKFTSYEFKFTNYELKFTSYEFKSTSYGFKSTNRRIVKSINSLLKQPSKTHFLRS